MVDLKPFPSLCGNYHRPRFLWNPVSLKVLTNIQLQYAVSANFNFGQLGTERLLCGRLGSTIVPDSVLPCLRKCQGQCLPNRVGG